MNKIKGYENEKMLALLVEEEKKKELEELNNQTYLNSIRTFELQSSIKLIKERILLLEKLISDEQKKQKED